MRRIVSAIGYLWMNPSIVVVRLSDGEEGDRAGPAKNDEVENLEEDEGMDKEEVLVDTEAEDDGATEHRWLK